MKTIYPPALDRLDLVPLPTPRASLAKIAWTCLRRITLPIEFAMARDQIKDIRTELRALDRLFLLNTVDGCSCGVERCRTETAAAKKHLAELEAWQRSLEREARS